MKLSSAFLILFGLFAFHSPTASAEVTLPLQFTHLAPYVGKKLTLLFVQGQRPIVGTEDSQITVLEVKAVIPSIEVKSDQISIRPVNIPRAGIGRANFLIAVIHSQPNYFWSNADEGLAQPRDPRLKMGQSPLEGESTSIKIQVFSRIQFDAGSGNAFTNGNSHSFSEESERESNIPVVLEIQSP